MKEGRVFDRWRHCLMSTYTQQWNVMLNSFSELCWWVRTLTGEFNTRNIHVWAYTKKETPKRLRCHWRLFFDVDYYTMGPVLSRSYSNTFEGRKKCEPMWTNFIVVALHYQWNHGENIIRLNPNRNKIIITSTIFVMWVPKMTGS